MATGHVCSSDAILPRVDECTSRPTELELKYNGGDCAQSDNRQAFGQSSCTDYNGGPPSTGSVYVHILDEKISNDYFLGTVLEVGDFLQVIDGGEKLSADINIRVFADESGYTNWTPGDETDAALLQIIKFHTSCSKGTLFLKDKFGAFQVTMFNNDFGEFSSSVLVMFRSIM